MIVATAGHVDHGKTSLVKALTGTDTDRLPEEKKRGLTIDLGFAYLKTESGQSVAFIDVPGHEKFVRNAIAGVGLADVAIVAIAADDGPMPQTLEHLAILDLLQVGIIVPVITKVDLVDAPRIGEVDTQIAELLASAPSRSETFMVSQTDADSIERLKQHILSLVEKIGSRRQSGNFRMAIDRSFTLEGSGTVVTGTVASGEVTEESSLTLISDTSHSGKSARVRSLHTQNAKSVSARTGQRCALNLTGDLTKSAMQRGSWLVSDADFRSTYLLDVMIQLAPLHHNDASKSKSTNSTATQHRRLKHWTPAHLHIGTADISCRIALLEATTLDAGERSLARLICDKPVAGVHGDRFILRDQSARSTIAGGVVLDPHPPRRGRGKPERLQVLRALDEKAPDRALTNLLEQSHAGINLSEFGRNFDLPSDELNTICQTLDLTVVGGVGERWSLTQQRLIDLKQAIVNKLDVFHQQLPDIPGVDLTGINKLQDITLAIPVIEHCLKELVSSKKVTRTGTLYSLVDHQVTLSVGDQKHWDIVESELLAKELVPPRVVELADSLNKTPDETISLLMHFVAHGKIYKVTDNRYFLPQTVKRHAAIAIKLSEGDSLTVAEYRNESGIGRNLVVELLEYFDRIRFTQRIGDKRQVLSSEPDRFW